MLDVVRKIRQIVNEFRVGLYGINNKLNSIREALGRTILGFQSVQQ